MKTTEYKIEYSNGGDEWSPCLDRYASEGDAREALAVILPRLQNRLACAIVRLVRTVQQVEIIPLETLVSIPALAE